MSAAKGKGWERDYPYYKVQTFDDRVVAWKDLKRAFASEETAREYIATELPDVKSRVVVVKGERDRQPLEEE